MRFLKTNILGRIVNSYLVDNPQPTNISYIWNFGSLLGTCLVIQIVTGILLAIHYNSSTDLAFISVEHIIRDVNYGWLLRYAHANGASFFFMFVYAHIGRGLIWGSYKRPKTLIWSVGVIILILIIATAFLGYCLPYGQISLWGATVICNLLSALPWIGKSLVEFVWGGFSVGGPTLNRFFSLHYLLPFILAALSCIHIVALHKDGSGNPLGITGNVERTPIHPYFTFKDLVTIFLFLLVFSFIIFYYPNILGHSDNYIPANPIVTPASIVPEWYLLPFYCILRAIPNKLLGVVGIFASLVILLFIGLLDRSIKRGNEFRPIFKLSLCGFYAVFFILIILGARHVEQPYVLLGQLFTFLYFFWFLNLPLLSLIEGTIEEIAKRNK